MCSEHEKCWQLFTRCLGCTLPVSKVALQCGEHVVVVRRESFTLNGYSTAWHMHTGSNNASKSLGKAPDIRGLCEDERALTRESSSYCVHIHIHRNALHRISRPRVYSSRNRGIRLEKMGKRKEVGKESKK